MSWLLGGADFIDEFTKERSCKDSIGFTSDTFFEIVKGGNGAPRMAAMVKLSVINVREAPSVITSQLRRQTLTVTRQKWIQHLREADNCSEFVHDFLNLISMDMLVVEQLEPEPGNGDADAAAQPLSPPPTARRNSRRLKRSTCSEVLNRLRTLAEKCRTEPGYATAPRPWSKTAKNATGSNLEAVETELTQERARLVKREQLREHTGAIVPRRFSRS